MVSESEFASENSSKFSLSHLTLLDCSIPELVYIASRAGYDAISPRLIPMGVDGEMSCLPNDKEMLRATRNALDITDLVVNDIELARITDDCDVLAYESALAIGAELGARKLIASVWTTSDNDRDYIVHEFAKLCDLAAQYHLTVVLEFPTFSRITTLNEAVDIVKAAGRKNSGILLDTLYTHMSRVNPEELVSLPSEWFSFMHISDVLPGIPDTREGMIQLARDARLYPGEGCINFRAFLKMLPPVDFSIELPNKSRINELGYEEHARRCLNHAKSALGLAS